jgi:hypothetical protein
MSLLLYSENASFSLVHSYIGFVGETFAGLCAASFLEAANKALYSIGVVVLLVAYFFV